MVTKERVWTVPLPDGRIAEHVRIDGPDGKRVWWRIGDVNSLGGMPSSGLPLYGADRLTGDQTTTVVVCEGEPAADALIDRGIEAVGTVTGANGTPCDDSLRCLIRRSVILWPDNDKPGRGHMNRISERLLALGATYVRIVLWEDAPPKGDAVDFSGDAEELRELFEAATSLDALAHPHAEPLDLGALLDDVREMITKYVVLSGPQADAVTLWIAHTHAIDAADTTPYLNVNSAEKQSGKTRLLEVQELLVRRPWKSDHASAAALYRKVEKDCPTLLLDESDAAFGGNKEYAETLRGVLNSGHRRGGTVTRCVGPNFDVREFSTFCPKAIAGIGKLPETVADRSITITMKRRSRREKVSKFRHRAASVAAAPLRTALEDWAIGAITSLRNARPDIPDELSDRAADGWESLLAIADLAGGNWSHRVREAAVRLSADQTQDEQSTGVQLLKDVAAVFDKGAEPQMPSALLVEQLVAMEESPWGEWHGRGLTAQGLAKLLKPFGVRPRSVRISNRTPKGYRRSDLEDAWVRYTPYLAATPQQSESERKTALIGPSRKNSVADGKAAEIGLFERNVAGVADESWGPGLEVAWSQKVMDL